MTQHLVVMGVSGTGKTTVGSALAARLSMPFVEGDRLHPDANVAKMSAGVPLDDDDRRPWLQALSAELARYDADGQRAVLTCSALKRAYRDLLRAGLTGGSLYFVHLAAPFDVLRARMEAREHFMPPSLLQSQFDTLEPLEPDEDGAVFDVTDPVDRVVDEAERAVRERPADS